MANWQLALVVLVALLVGAFLPVLLQARATLRAAEKRLNSKQLEETMNDLHAAARGLRVLGRHLESGDKEIGEVIVAMRELGHAVTKVRDSVKVVAAIGAAVGPAVAAAVRALQQEDDDAASPEDSVEPSNEAAEAEVATIGRASSDPKQEVKEKRRAP